MLLTRAGEVTFSRPYWHCDCCGRGYFSDAFGDRLPSSQASWAVKSAVGRLSAKMSFAEAVSEWTYITGHPVSARSAEYWVEEIGRCYQMPELSPHDPGPRVDVVFVQADAVQVGFRDGWHEEKVMASWGRVEEKDQPIHYAAGEGQWQYQTKALATLTRRAGSRLAREIVCIADGAPGIWQEFSRIFPGARQILDWYHLQEHIGQVAALLPDGSAWHDRQKAALVERGPSETFAELAKLTRAGQTAEIRLIAWQCFKYMFRNRRRLDYPEARRLGYPIGSGRIESACKQVVAMRCKGTGMRWNHPHAQAVLKARCALLNGDWELAMEQTIRKAA